MDTREHVVFHPTPSGRPGHTRTPSLEEALSVVERLRNDHGVTDVEVAVLRPVPLTVRPYWVVEVASAASLPDDALPDHAPPDHALPDHAPDPASPVPPAAARREAPASPAGRRSDEALPGGQRAQQEPRVEPGEVTVARAPAAPVRDQAVVEDAGAAGGSTLHAAVPDAAGRTAAAHGASRPAAAPAPREPQEQEAAAPGAAASGAAAPSGAPEGRRERRGLGFFA